MALEMPRPLSADSAETAAPAGDQPASLRYELTMVRPRAAPGNVRAPAWIDRDGVIRALLYVDEAAPLGASARASFIPAAAPDAAVAVVRTGAPAEAWEDAIVRVGWRVDAGTPPRAGATGWLVLPDPAAPQLVVPDPAIVRGPDGPYVLVAAADGTTFSKRRVRVGRSFVGVSAILSGLDAGERVVAGNAFLLDAEERLQAAGARARNERP